MTWLEDWSYLVVHHYGNLIIYIKITQINGILAYCKPATTSTPKQSGCTNNVIDTTTNQVTEDDLRTIKELKSTIDTLNSIITNLRIENESLRMSRIHRVRRLDESPDILDESIDDVQLYKLYQAVSTLYKARFPDK